MGKFTEVTKNYFSEYSKADLVVDISLSALGGYFITDNFLVGFLIIFLGFQVVSVIGDYFGLDNLDEKLMERITGKGED